MPASPMLDCLIGCAIAAALAAGLGMLLRACGLRRAWVVSGLCVGVLLGPQGMARVRGDWFDRFWFGAAIEGREAFVAARAIEVASVTAAPRGASVDSDAKRFRIGSEDQRGDLVDDRSVKPSSSVAEYGLSVQSIDRCC